MTKDFLTINRGAVWKQTSESLSFNLQLLLYVYTYGFLPCITRALIARCFSSMSDKNL